MIYKLLNTDLPVSPSSTFPTVYLASLNYGNDSTNTNHMRQVFFAKLQVELRERGIEIEEHYPELYNQLCSYISATNEVER